MWIPCSRNPDLHKHESKYNPHDQLSSETLKERSHIIIICCACRKIFASFFGLSRNSTLGIPFEKCVFRTRLFPHNFDHSS